MQKSFEELAVLKGARGIMKKVTTLREVLDMCKSGEALPDEWDTSRWDKDYDNILPECGEISVRFMSDEETWVDTYVTHPILLPWYDCPIEDGSVEAEDGKITVFLEFEGEEGFLRKMIDDRQRKKGAEDIPGVWISTKQGLPTKNGTYLAWGKRGYSVRTISDPIDFYWFANNATHWRLLPEPPKEEDDGK